MGGYGRKMGINGTVPKESHWVQILHYAQCAPIKLTLKQECCLDSSNEKNLNKLQNYFLNISKNRHCQETK